MPRLRLKRGSALPVLILLSALAGLTLFLAHPPAGIRPLALVAVAPLLFMVRRARARRAFLLGLVFGVAYFAATLYWLQLFGELGWSALSLLSGAFVGVVAALVPRVWRDGRPLVSALGLAALWTAGEYVRSLWPLGGFTWGGLGYTQVENPLLLPLAAVAGVWGVSFVVALANSTLAVVADAVVGRRDAERSRRWRPTAAVAMVASVALVAPAAIPFAEAAGPPLDVAVVQGNDIEENVDDPRRQDFLIARTHARLHRRLAGDPPDLSIWPENSVDRDPGEDPALAAVVRDAIRSVGAPTLIGAITGDAGGSLFNEAVLFDGDAAVVDRYAKVHLVPFGEFVPWRAAIGWISALEQIERELTPGRELSPLVLGDLELPTLICYENTFPSLVRSMTGENAALVVVITNNASYRRTAASEQHLDMSRMRAVENGRWVVHAAISGISAFVDPSGRVHQATRLFELTLNRRPVPTSAGRTLYNRLGDVAAWASVATVALLALRTRPGRRRRHGGPLGDDARTLVVIPTYNERTTIEEVVSRLLDAVPRADVLVVDDSSPDGTARAVEQAFGSDPRVRVAVRPSKSGLSSAYVHGFDVALAEGYAAVVEMDADLSHQPEELPRILAALEDADLVVGSRYVEGGSVTNWGLIRRGLSRGGNLYARGMLGFPVRDSTSGFRAFRSELLRELVAGGVRSDGYGFQIELAYRAWRNGWRLAEVPITFREREHGQSKISRRIVVEALVLVAWWGLRDRLRGAPSKSLEPAEAQTERP